MSYQSSQDPEDKLPDWLKALRTKQNQPEPPKTQAEQPSSEEGGETEPSWLREIRERHRRERPTDEELLQEERALSDTQPTPPAKPLEKRRLEPLAIEEQPAQEPEPPTDESAEPASEPVEAVPAAAEESVIPDWLTLEEEAKKLLAEDADADSHAPAFSAVPDEEALSPAELPSWLQAIRPAEGFPEEDKRSSAMLPESEEKVGPLAGLSGVLPAEPDVVQFGKAPVFSARLDITESQALHAGTFSRLIAEEGKAKEDQTRRVALPNAVLNGIISAAIFVSVLFPLVTGSQNAPRPELDAYPESSAIFNVIDVLPPDAPVLVAFDVQPALYGDIQAPATAVLSHLLDKQARLVFFSTQPAGPATAERLLTQTLSTFPSVATGDYVNLGYLSGGMAALRSFASAPRTATLSAAAALQNPWASAALQSVNQLTDFALVILIVSDAEDGRAWIEQTTTALPNGFVLVTTTQGAPLLRPYLTTNPPRLQGLIAGISGGTFYERARNQEGIGRSYWDSFSFGLGAVLLLVLLGGLYGRLIHLRPEKQETEGKNAK
jgi:hypothetical protein